MTFDPSDLANIRRTLLGKGFAVFAKNVPTKPTEVTIQLPPKILNQFATIRAIAYRVGALHHRVQEFLGEIATSLLAHAVGFEQTSMQWSGVHGPDQVVQHASGLWGVFEAKGGKHPKLGRKLKKYGLQMSRDWLSGWLEEIHLLNENRPGDAGKQGRSLRKAFRSGTPMVAAISRIEAENAGSPRRRLVYFGLKMVFQKYTPPSGKGMSTFWGRGWNF